MLVQWARHGENVANVTRTLSYRSFDCDLTARGRTQAHDLGRRLAGQSGPPPGLLACSPTRRARQTAEIVGRCLGLAVKCELDDLRELNVGSLDGRSDEEAWATYDWVLDGWRRGQRDRRFPGGEDCFELCRRLGRALQAVASISEEGPAVIVAHGANLRASTPWLLGAPEPGRDLAVADVASLDVASDAGGRVEVKLLCWGETDGPRARW